MMSFSPWRIGLALGVAALAGGSVAQAPRDLAQRIAQARPGTTMRLAPGDYGVLSLAHVRFARPLVIDAGQSRFTGIVLNDVHGLTLLGGTIVGPGGRSYGLKIDRSSAIRVERMEITGAHRGVVANMSEDLAFVGNRFHDLISDGLDVALSRRVLIERNSCRDFHYTRPVFTPDGVRLADGDHPDCIQLWSRPQAPPVADVQVIDNEIDGYTQGIWFGDGIHNGVADGGFDRVLIRGNRVRVAFPNGISLLNGRDSVVRDNRVDTTPGARLPKPPFNPVRANLRVTGERNLVCGNVVTAVPGAAGSAPCP